MKRRCCGCKNRKEGYCEVGPRAWYCIDCARSSGITGGKPRNVAAQQSAKWFKEPCKHPSQRNRYVIDRATGRKCLIGECQRCNAEVWRVFA